MICSRLSSVASRRILQRSTQQWGSSFQRNFSNVRKFMVVNVVGLDRPGIVSDLSEVIISGGGNVGESRAVKLGDHFSMMMLADVPEDVSASVKDAIANLDGLNASVFDTTDPNAIKINPTIGYEGELSLSGADHPGIVHKIASLLAKHRLNIDDLETSDEIAPHGGTTLFLMKCSVNAIEPIPKDFNIADVKKDLEKLADSLNCDIELEDVHNDLASFGSM